MRGRLLCGLGRRSRSRSWARRAAARGPAGDRAHVGARNGGLGGRRRGGRRSARRQGRAADRALATRPAAVPRRRLRARHRGGVPRPLRALLGQAARRSPPRPRATTSGRCASRATGPTGRRCAGTRSADLLLVPGRRLAVPQPQLGEPPRRRLATGALARAPSEGPRELPHRLLAPAPLQRRPPRRPAGHRAAVEAARGQGPRSRCGATTTTCSDCARGPGSCRSSRARGDTASTRSTARRSAPGVRQRRRAMAPCGSTCGPAARATGSSRRTATVLDSGRIRCRRA